MDDRSGQGAEGLREMLRVVREHKLLIFAAVVLTGLAAYFASTQRPERYEAVSRILIKQDDLGSSVVGIDRAAPGDPQRESATILELMRQPMLANRALRAEPELDLTAGQLLAKVRGEAAGNSSLVSVIATDDEPRRAALLSNTFAEAFVDFRAESERERVARALDGIEARLNTAERRGREVTARRLRRQREEVALLESLQVGDAQLVQRAQVPDTPVGPSAIRNLALGLIFGLLLGLALAFLRDRTDTRVRRQEDVEELFPGVPTIGVLPSWRGRGKDAKVGADAFRSLPTTLNSLDPERSLRTLLITSATVGEGKSATSLNLALALAERDESVVLLETDMRRRGLSERLGLTARAGMSNVLRGEGPFDDYLVQVSLNGASSNGRGHHTPPNGNGRGSTAAMPGIVNLLPAGPVPANPHALLSGRAIDEVLATASASADRVVIDGTPVGLISDALPIASRVDGVLVIAHLKYTRRADLRRLIRQLHQIGVTPAGLVIFSGELAHGYDAYLKR